MVLRASAGDSDHVIAELCKVSHTLVVNLRRQLATVASCAKRTGRDGKARRLPKKPKSRRPKSAWLALGQNVQFVLNGVACEIYE